jgi:ATP sulfurylase/adenylyl-sulfate kinase
VADPSRVIGILMRGELRVEQGARRQTGVTVWFTGLSGAGKTTIAQKVEEILKKRGLAVERLDGDTVRQGLTRDLGFSREDRDKNIERVTFVAKLLTRNNVIVLASFISPYKEARERSRREIGNFLLVYVTAPMETLLARDVKGLYRKAMAGEIQNFTGVNDPYEVPENPDLVCDTDRESVLESAGKVLNLLVERGYIEPGPDLPVAAGFGKARVEVSDRSQVTSAAQGAAVPVTPGPVSPHGGTLINRELTGEERAAALAQVDSLVGVSLDERELADLEMIGVGGLSPLCGFMNRAEYESVLENMRLPDGLIWPLPVTLAVDQETAVSIREGQVICLRGPNGEPVGLLDVQEKYTYDKRREAQLAFGTTDGAHPGVVRVYRQGEVLIAGPVRVLNRPSADQFSQYRLTPLELRRIFDERGWRSVVAFQTRNPVHRAHEYLQKCALEMVDGLLLHPLVGATKSDDVPADVRMRAYEVILQKYYPANRVQLSVFPAAMRYAGPREAVFHAICRKNYGCTHFIVGRDHAGVGNYYGTYEAQELISRFRPEELGITPLLFEHAFYCRACGNMATAKTCPHSADQHLFLSGTKVRAMLQAGETPPEEFTRPEVAEVLINAARQNAGARK